MCLKRTVIAFMVAALCLPAAKSMADTGGKLQGHVLDSQTREPLVGATVLIPGTALGASTDLNGGFVISNVPAGTYKIRATYIGYLEKELQASAVEDRTVKVDFLLDPVGVTGKEVVVTAQVAGQNSAINQQLASDQIENVVSAAKIKELPDANAAESVGRLPGVWIIRSGGEGDYVTIRGLQPKYNQITIDGIAMGSSDANDRSTDLSMISSDMLGGIEVKKSVTADMDADVIGGSVNFEMREAQVKTPGVPVISLSVQGGYKNLSDASNKYNNYKYTGSAEDRLLGDQLGVFAQVEIERRNLTSDQLSAYYDHAPGNNTTQYITTGLSLFYLPRDRQRYNGALNLDYKLPDGSIKLINFVSSSVTNSEQAENDFSISNTGQTYQLLNTDNRLNNIVDAIELDDGLPFFHLDAKISHTYSETVNPGNWGVSFAQGSQGLAQFKNQPDINPQNVVTAANNDYGASYLTTVTNDNSFARQRAFSGSVDLTRDINPSDAFSAHIKVGGKYTYQTRSYDFNQYNSEPLNEPGDQFTDNLITQYFSIPVSSYNIPMTYFIDPNFNYGTFLNGNYKMNAPLNSSMMSRLVNLLQDSIGFLANNNHAFSYFHNVYASAISNYSGHESHSAVYGMLTLNFGSNLTLIPGVRYQDLQTVYTGVRGLLGPNDYLPYNHYDTTVTQTHGYLLPDVTLRYKPLSWFDVRLSYTNTLAYPDYSSIIPKIDMSGTSIGWINFKLTPSRSTNYDGYLSFYDNSIGLFTAGLFLKQIDNLIYPWSFYASGANVVPYLPSSIVTTYNPNTTYSISTYLNDSYRVNDYGMELDWQTYLWYLPGPLSGIVVAANYTHIFSKAKYPYTILVSTGRTLTPVDTSYTNPLIDQPDNIINLSVGFDYDAFSVRVALLYQSNVFTGPNFWPQLKSYTAAYRRWDIAAKQGLPWSGLELYADLNNINGANDLTVIQAGSVPEAEQDYGMTADVGLRLKF